MATKSNKSVNWERLFEEYDLLNSIKSRGFADITSEQIKRLNLEPRLLGKIDHNQNLPQVFSRNDLTILTISNSAYRIGAYDIFQGLPEWKHPGSEVTKLPRPRSYETLNFSNLTSEPQVINAANVSEILEDFFGEPTELTISGRGRTPEFDFHVNLIGGGNQSIQVSKAQIEIDAGYEGKRGFYIIEAKNHSASNFNLRQLYYPYRTWNAKIKKQIFPIFLTYSNDVFDFFRFEFTNLHDFSSATLTKHSRYMLAHDNITTRDIEHLAKSAKPHFNPGKIPFPQADSFERVVDLVSVLLEDSPKSQGELADHYVFVTRQSDYYWNAARFLGLADSEQSADGTPVRIATDKAREIFSLEYREKYLALAKLILDIPGVSSLYLEWRKNGKVTEQTARKLVDINRDGQSYSESTVIRRIQTIMAWVSWLIALPDSA